MSTTISDYNWCARCESDVHLLLCLTRLSHFILFDLFDLYVWLHSVLKNHLEQMEMDLLNQESYFCGICKWYRAFIESNVMRKFNKIAATQITTISRCLYGINGIINICRKNWRDIKKGIKKNQRCIWLGLSFLKKCAFKWPKSFQYLMAQFQELTMNSVEHMQLICQTIEMLAN